MLRLMHTRSVFYSTATITYLAYDNRIYEKLSERHGRKRAVVRYQWAPRP